MANSYEFELPSGVPVDEGIIQFFKTFYKTSDTPTIHEEYVTSFTENAIMIMASRRSEGRDGMFTITSAFINRAHATCPSY